jgi:hypothetical protein
MEVKLQLLALDVSSSELKWYKPIPRDEEMLPLSKVERIDHMAYAGILIKKHVFLHLVALRV